MNKYYTPKIEEFHVGFEYEYQDMLPHGGSVDWFKGIFKTDDSLELIFKSNDWYDLPRVKYLDREDIESLGFTYDKTSDVGQLKFFKGNICLYYRPATNELGTFTVDPSKSDYMMKYVMDDKKAHILIIKNKMELSKLLKQLRIC